ncbi:MAG TPA: RibD family protein [Polyangiaceae bacterium]
MKRPRVWINMASSIDGKSAPAPSLRPPGQFMMSRGTVDRATMRELRAQADAVLVGAGNLRADDPDLALAAPERARRRSAGEREPLRVVVTREGGGLSPSMKMFDPARGGPAIIAHTRPLTPATQAALSAVAEVVHLDACEADVSVLLTWLGDVHGCRTVLCEGGGLLNATLFEARAVDELYLTLTPRILGGVTAPGTVNGAGFPPSAVPDATLVDLRREGDELLLRYRFDWAAAPGQTPPLPQQIK